jgi:hypothetical protein
MNERIDGRRQRRINITRKIITVTAREIRGTGQWRPAMRQIASLARCSVRTVFQIFGEQNTLLRAVYATHTRDLLVTFRAQFPGIIGTEEKVQRELIEALMGIGMPSVPTAIWTAVAQETIAEDKEAA